MCTRMKWVNNPYSHYKILVPCGKCPSCQMEKANHRTARIHNNSKQGYINLFTTFTYANSTVPYIKRSELLTKPSTINIYRDTITRRVRCSTDYKMRNRRSAGEFIIDSVDVFPEYYDNFDINSFHVITNDSTGDKIAVCYYKDIQNFYKRLRQNLKRVYNYEKPFSFFQCSELGSKTWRSHFHGLISIPYEDEELFRKAINASWTFNDWSCAVRKIEVARNASSYVSSYINRGSSFPRFFEQNAFRPKHSYSKGYGLSEKSFTLAEIQKSVDRRDMHYNIMRTDQNGVPSITSVLLPKYVLNRYFPKFKGFSRLTSFEVRELLECPKRYAKYAKILDLSCDDIHKFVVMITNSKERYVSSGGSPSTYSDYFVRAWKEYSMTVLRDFYENKECLPWFHQYDNLIDLMYNVRNYTLEDLIRSYIHEHGKLSFDEFHPNKIPFRVTKTKDLETLFHQKMKTKYITNSVMTSNGAYV